MPRARSLSSKLQPVSALLDDDPQLPGLSARTLRMVELKATPRVP